MLTRYTVGGFAAAFIIGAIFWSMFPRLPAGNGWKRMAKSWLRGLVFDAGLLGAFLAGALLSGSENVAQMFLGALAEVSVSWAFTVLALSWLVLRWIFTDKPIFPKVEASGPPVHWQLNDEEVERSLRFDTMRLRTEVISSPFDSDGEFLLHMDKQGRNTWDESLKEEGWTQHDWQDYSVHEFEVRRLAPDRWECRATEKYWNRDARQDREWAKYTSVPPMREQEPRDWKPLDEAWVPPIETAYQRYIHQAPEPRRGTQDSPEAA